MISEHCPLAFGVVLLLVFTSSYLVFFLLLLVWLQITLGRKREALFSKSPLGGIALEGMGTLMLVSDHASSSGYGLEADSTIQARSKNHQVVKK